jgi:hypothetical protein
MRKDTGMLHAVFLAAVLLLSACTLPPWPKPETIPVETDTPQVAAPAPEVKTIFLPSPQECINVVQVPSLDVGQLPAKPGTKAAQLLPASFKGKSLTATLAKIPTPAEVVTQGQRDARVTLTAENYFGQNGEAVYTWTPGRIFPIYLTQHHATLLTLPPGETMLAGLILPKDTFEVVTKRAGAEPYAYDGMAITTSLEKGEIDTFILTASGRRYLLHLVIGQIGMVSVGFEAAGITQAVEREPRLMLPKPPSSGRWYASCLVRLQPPAHRRHCRPGRRAHPHLGLPCDVSATALGRFSGSRSPAGV